MKKSFFILSFVLLCLLCGIFSACGRVGSEYTLTYSAEIGGSIQGEAVQSVHEGKNGKQVIAVPDEGYEFIRWSDTNSTDPVRTDCNVKSDVTATAVFGQTFTVYYEAGEGGYILGPEMQTIGWGKHAESVTAIPYEGFHFVKWSDEGSDVPTRTDVNIKKNIHVTAIFARETFTVTYRCESIYDGRIEGKKSQQVGRGLNAETVVAVPRIGCVFLGWSDGITTPERQDVGVMSDMELTAYFGYSVEYKVNTDKGGTISGKTYQAVLPGEDLEEVTAIANAGYVFAGWSDLTWETDRHDLCVKQSFEYVAYFEPIERTYRYDYGEAVGAPYTNEITLNRNALSGLEFVLPALPGYTFCGWYADATYKIKVVDETGTYMLGDYGLELETDTLYARWKRDGEDEVPVHKILLVCVQELYVTLYSEWAEKWVEVNYRMTSIERQFCIQTSVKMHDYLNECFEGEIKFEVDSYFTQTPLGEENIGWGLNGISHRKTYDIQATDIPEVGPLNLRYHNVLTVASFNQTDKAILHDSSGVATKKYACVWLDSMLHPALASNHGSSWATILDVYKNGTEYDGLLMTTYLHEFAHTCEMLFYGKEILEFHDYLYQDDAGKSDGPVREERVRLYLLGKAELNGKTSEILQSYWRNEYKPQAAYGSLMINGYIVGRVVLVGAENQQTESVVRYLEYGSEITVEAIPLEGYRFVRWTDGVTTARRSDIVISYLDVDAIFIKENN